jgi:hypothetical protein
MFIFNTTFLVNNDRFDEWQRWMKEIYAPAIGGQMLTHGFEVFEVVSSNDENTRTFSAQWRCENDALLGQIDDYSSDVLQSMSGHFGESVLHFSSVLQQFKMVE